MRNVKKMGEKQIWWWLNSSDRHFSHTLDTDLTPKTIDRLVEVVRRNKANRCVVLVEVHGECEC